MQHEREMGSQQITVCGFSSNSLETTLYAPFVCSQFLNQVPKQHNVSGRDHLDRSTFILLLQVFRKFRKIAEEAEKKQGPSF